MIRSLVSFRARLLLGGGGCSQDIEPSDSHKRGPKIASHQIRWLTLLVVIATTSVPANGQQAGPSSSPPTDGKFETRPRRPEPTVSRLLEELRGGATSQLSRIRIAKAQAQAGDRVGARAALERELQAADGPRSLFDIAEVQGYIGDRDAALSTLLRARKASLLTEDDPDGLKVYALGQIATAQLRMGDGTAGRDSFEQTLGFARTLEPKKRAYLRETVIRQEADAGELVAAVETVASVVDLNERIDALTAIDIGRRDVDAEVAGRILRVLDIEWTPEAIHQVADWRRVQLKRLKIDTLVALALTEARANHKAEARTILRDAMKVAETLLAKPGHYRCLGTITKALVKAGATGEASRIANIFGETDRNIRFSLLSDIAEAHTEIGDRAATLKAWNDALEAAGTDAKKLRALMGLSRALIASGDCEAARRALDQALIAAKSIMEDDPDPGFFALNVNGIARARAQAKDIAGAIRLANTIPNNQIAGDALASVAELQAGSGDIKGALDTAGMIRPPNMGMISHLGDRKGALLIIIEIQAREGDVAGALATAERLSSERDGKWLAVMVLAQGLEHRGMKRGLD
jgi:tetratricopeptide (TPR) repeat protein